MRLLWVGPGEELDEEPGVNDPGVNDPDVNVCESDEQEGTNDSLARQTPGNCLFKAVLPATSS